MVRHKKIEFPFPIYINKFLEKAEMDSNNFFLRWRKLSEKEQECQKIFAAKYPINYEDGRQKLEAFGWSVLKNIDTLPDNYCGAAILHTSAQQIGCLYRLEPNKDAKMYRLTIRASKEGISQRLVELLEDQF